MRKVIFTENQLKKILGENFDTYLPKAGENSETPDNANLDTVMLTGKDSNGEPFEPPITDKIRKERTPALPFFRRISENSELNEENHELVGHQYNLGRNTNAQIDALAAQNPNDKLLQNMSNDKNMKHGTAKKRKHDLEVMKAENPERFNMIGGNKILKGINNKLNNDMKMSKDHKYFEKDVLGKTNVFQKEGGTKNNGGEANTKKDGVTITYEN